MYVINDGNCLTVIVIYVDDILFMSQDCTKLEEFKKHLQSQLDVKYSGLVEYCLGINFKQVNGTICMTQESYIRELLSRFNLSDANPVACPMDPSIRLEKVSRCNSNEEEDFPYRQLVGALNYLATCTRPDIANAVSRLSQFLNCYGKEHWIAGKRVLRYLKGTMKFGLVFRSTDEPLYGYTDADWGNSLDDRKSFTGYCFLLSGSAISWESRKQCTVALSSTEAEYMALSDGTKKAIYLKNLMKELGFKARKIEVYTDNIGTIKISENPVFHRRTKHIDIRHHFIRYAIQDGLIALKHVPTEDMGADVLTKPLSKVKHYKCLSILGIVDTSAY